MVEINIFVNQVCCEFGGDDQEVFEHLNNTFISINPRLAKDFVKFYFLLYPQNIDIYDWLTKKQSKFYWLTPAE